MRVTYIPRKDTMDTKIVPSPSRTGGSGCCPPAAAAEERPASVQERPSNTRGPESDIIVLTTTIGEGQ